MKKPLVEQTYRMIHEIIQKNASAQFCKFSKGNCTTQIQKMHPVIENLEVLFSIIHYF